MSGDDLRMELVDGRDALGIVILRETDQGIVSDVRGLRVDKLTAARIFYQLAKQLKALHDAESADPGGGRSEAGDRG